MRLLLALLVAVPSAGGCFGTDTPQMLADVPPADASFVFLLSQCKSPSLLRVDGAGRLVHVELLGPTSDAPASSSLPPARVDAILAEAEEKLGLDATDMRVVHAEEVALPREDFDGLRLHVAEAELSTLESRYANEDIVDGCLWRTLVWDGARHVVIEDVNGGGPERLRALIDFTRHAHV